MFTLYKIGDWVRIYNVEPRFDRVQVNGYAHRLCPPSCPYIGLVPSKGFKLTVLQLLPTAALQARSNYLLKCYYMLLGLRSNSVSNMRCKPCANSNGIGACSVHLPAGLNENILTHFIYISPLLYVTTDVEHDGRRQRCELDTITAHRIVCGRGGTVAVMYNTRWKGLKHLCWEREVDFLHFCPATLGHWNEHHAQRGARHLQYQKCSCTPRRTSFIAFEASVTSDLATSLCLATTTNVNSPSYPVVLRASPFGSRVVNLFGGLDSLGLLVLRVSPIQLVSWIVCV